MTWKQWLVQYLVLVVLSVGMTYLDTDLQARQLDEAAYLLEWLMVAAGLYALYLGCILQSAIIVRGWRLSAVGIRRLRNAL